ncbi:hypothetical protein [Tahibacter harae]|uniref:Tetratricopeptide repeat protein n=1 Tax=Tahibacter harae TaxID=2963937 RepID=A0ABT1QVV7_9GAMM|nr:hypothetical protein [Tahibacter harae]MCQ4166424.1 hypothetical protein [Tahibacter harae]
MHTSDALHGGQLEHFLDQTDETQYEQAEAGVAEDLRQAALGAALRRQPLRADTFDLVERLGYLWLQAGDPAAALRLLDNDAPAAIAALPPAERGQAELLCGFLRIQALHTIPDRAGTQQALLAQEQRLAALPPEERYTGAWNQLADVADYLGEGASARRAIRGRRALQAALPNRAACQAWDEAAMHLREGASHARAGEAENARLSALAALDSLAEAAPGQDVDYDDWLRLGHELIGFAPEQAGLVIGQVRARVPAAAGAAERRTVEARMARLQAVALARLGQLDQAIARGREGRFGLVVDSDDDFSAQMLDWLLQAGRAAEAAELAYECSINQRAISSGHARALAQSRVADCSAGAPYWALLLARAAGDDTSVCGRETPAAYARRLLDLAAAQSPGHTALDAAQAHYLARFGNDDAGALALLERVVQQPGQANSANLELLWHCRARLDQLRDAAFKPFVAAAGAGWNYRLGCILSSDLHASLPPGGTWPDEAMQRLALQYYEAGLAQFERFIESGSGIYIDGNIHTYSMLCNNLAIQYRKAGRPPEDRIALHGKGIAASPFAEHYDGLLSCAYAAGDDASYVAAAEQLWQYAADHGYSRHSPDDYIHRVAYRLRNLGRPGEIAIWLERLDGWFNTLDADDQAENAASYLETLAMALVQQAHSQPEDAVLRLERSLPQIRALKKLGTSRFAGRVLQIAGDHRRALEIFEEAAPWHRPGNTYDDEQYGYLTDEIAECRQALGGGKPWWRFW